MRVPPPLSPPCLTVEEEVVGIKEPTPGVMDVVSLLAAEAAAVAVAVGAAEEKEAAAAEGEKEEPVVILVGVVAGVAELARTFPLWEGGGGGWGAEDGEGGGRALKSPSKGVLGKALTEALRARCFFVRRGAAGEGAVWWWWELR